MDLLRPESSEAAQAIVDKYAADEPAILRRDFYNSLLASFTEDDVAAQLAEMNLSRLLIDVPDDRHWIVGGRLTYRKARCNHSGRSSPLAARSGFPSLQPSRWSSRRSRRPGKARSRCQGRFIFSPIDGGWRWQARTVRRSLSIAWISSSPGSCCPTESMWKCPCESISCHRSPPRFRARWNARAWGQTWWAGARPKSTGSPWI